MRNLALFSAYNKEGIASLARALAQKGMEIVATGKTRTLLQEEGLKVTDISELTQEPERFGGRLKTLHHKVFGGILLRPGEDDKEWPYDFRVGAVVCNFYPFREMAKKCQTLNELIEWIDIGGPSMVRAAAKNFKHVWVFTKPEQFTRFIAAPAHDNNEQNEQEMLRLRERFALQAFEMVREFDEDIQKEFQNRYMGLNDQGKLVYGENPQQESDFLPNLSAGVKFFGNLSFNNIRDAEAALRFVLPFKGPAASVVKHQTLCGAATGLPGASTDTIFDWAWEGDTVSRFGSVIAMNFVPSAAVTEILSKKFIEVLVVPRSPEAEEWALAFRATKDRVRIVFVEKTIFGSDYRLKEQFSGVLGQLGQEADHISTEGTDSDLNKLFQVTGEWAAACSKSNAIVMAGVDEKTRCAYFAGAGQGQPNRVDALKLLAIPRGKDFATRKNIPFESLTCFSDGFIPFPDSLKELHAAGLRKLVQPGGSKADPEIIATAKELGITMTITGTRHFWH